MASLSLSLLSLLLCVEPFFPFVFYLFFFAIFFFSFLQTGGGDTTPVIVGVAQWTNRGPDHVDPYKMTLKTSELALKDAISKGGNVRTFSPKNKNKQPQL